MLPKTASALRRELLKSPPLLGWCLFLLLMPFYLFPVGLPQLDDFIVVLLVPTVFVTWNGRLGRQSVSVLRALLLFTAWVVLVNLAWILILANFGKDLRYPLFYIFNALTFLLALILHQRHQDSFIRLTLYCVFGSVVFQAAISLVIRTSSSRGTLFFDNPNQLGYYALLAACVIALTQRRMGFGLLKSGVGLTCCGYLALISASRSAVLGVVILAILTMFLNPRLILIGSFAAMVLVLVGGPLADAVETMQTRLNTAHGDDQLSFFEQRGYDRIWTNKEYVLLGAGEGARVRFQENTIIKHAEIHSSIGTILFSYGLVGLTLFFVFLGRLVRGAALRSTMVLVPPLVYTIAHQGLRFTMLWVLFALFTALKERPPRAEAAGPKLSPIEHAVS